MHKGKDNYMPLDFLDVNAVKSLPHDIPAGQELVA
jgi:hypothetical protein